MARPRAELHAQFLAITPNVYFSPPSNLQMSYPCIRYTRSKLSSEYAGDKPYLHTKGYEAIVITTDVNSELHMEVAALPMSRFDRHYKADDLNHDVYTIFF